LDRASDATPAATEPAGAHSGVVARCWGTRGSIPTPGPQTVRYGGNTSCLEVRDGRTRLIFDAGSGIRALGHEIVARGPDQIHIFLTHFHWDHIQGFPFFAPLYDHEDTIKVVGPRQKDIGVENLFAGQMGPIYFPVPFSVVAATMEFEHLNEGTYEIDDALLRVIRVKHPSWVLGYRIELGGQVICFIPDNELEGDIYEVDAGWDAQLREFVAGADLLVHDAMFTEQEYPHRIGWGHSTFEQSLRLAEEVGVKRLLYFHHDPMRADHELDAILARLRDDALARGSTVEMEMATEGAEIGLEAWA
jgi:phosphoribosyl 1,2-cyclic phosphodiesterase